MVGSWWSLRAVLNKTKQNLVPLGPPCPSSQGPPIVPAEGGPNILKLKSSWHRRRRSKSCAISLKHWKGRASIWSGCSVRIRLWPCLPHGCHRLHANVWKGRGGEGGPGGGVPHLLLRCTAVLIHRWGGGPSAPPLLSTGGGPSGICGVCAQGGGRDVLEERWGGGGKILCTKNGPNQYFLL